MDREQRVIFEGTQKLSAFGVIKKALDIAITGPATDGRRQSSDPQKRLAYFAESIETALMKAGYLKKPRSEETCPQCCGTGWQNHPDDPNGRCKKCQGTGVENG